ncbi:MAG: MFS transporter [Anaerolineales bacterium]|nr:MAG: MFS transporter [Anaerolineales bacterium]
MRILQADRRLITVLSIVFVQMAGAAMILPILPLFAERQFSMSPTTVTLLVTSYFLAQFIAGPFLGQLSDQYGRIPLLVISQLGSAVSFFMMAMAGGPAMLFAARLVDGITGGNIIVAQAYITDIVPREKRTEALGYILAVFGIGFIVGPALGGVLSAWLGARMPFIIAGLAAALTAVMSFLFLNETVDRQSPVVRDRRRVRLSPVEVARNYPLVLILVVAFVGQFGFGMLQSTFALYGSAVLFRTYSEQSTNLGVGLLLAVVGLGQFVTQTSLIGPMKRRFGDALLVIQGALIRMVGLAILALVSSPWPAAVSCVFFAVGMGLMMPPLQSLATRTVSETNRGGVLGIYQSSASLAIIFSTAIAGAIFTLNPSLPYWIGAILSLAVVLPAGIVLRLSRQAKLNPAEVVNPAD